METRSGGQKLHVAMRSHLTHPKTFLVPLALCINHVAPIWGDGNALHTAAVGQPCHLDIPQVEVAAVRLQPTRPVNNHRHNREARDYECQHIAPPPPSNGTLLVHTAS